MGTGRVSVEGSAALALREMRAARRRRYVQQLDLMEVLYRVYVGAIFAAVGLGVLAGAVNEAAATPTAINSLRSHGPALLGMAVAVCVLAGLRAGARGGPLAIEKAELQYVLLAPVDRGAALRPAAWRQLRIGALSGAILGAVVGNFVFRRLPGSPLVWILCLALFGALVPCCVLAGALLASGRRLRPLFAAAAGVLVLAWSGADLALGWSSSPATMLGDLATLPLQSGGRVELAALGVAVVFALLGFGLIGLGGILLEAARRRASLTAELRFSASVQDLRTVVLLRRQLASERPRRRPWLRLGVGAASRHPIWRRGWQSLLRWPAARVARAALLGVLAGAVMVGAWSGATAAFFVPGVLLFIAALDSIEPLAQESDHPTRRQLLPLASSKLMPRHLAAPAAVIAAMIFLAAAAAAAIGGEGGTALGVAAVMAVPGALVLACCAAFSATADPYAYLLVPQIGYAVSAAPVLGAALAIGLPTLIAREAQRHGGQPVPAAAGVAFVIAAVSMALVAVLGQRFAKRDAAA